MAEIILLTGQIALVDDEDFQKVASYRWHFSDGYARTSVKLDGKWVTIRLHRLIMDAKPGEEIDHENGIKLDCRKMNLRRATRKIQVANQRIRSHCLSKSSRFKGVYLKRPGRWGAQLRTTVNGRPKQRYLGYFPKEEDAASAYNAAASEYFGKYALLNPV